MDIKWIKTCTVEGEPPPDGNDLKLIVQIDKETEVIVYGYGCGLASMIVRSMIGFDGSDDPTASVGQDVWDVIAKAIVWASPTTIAHLVMDTINNQ